MSIMGRILRLILFSWLLAAGARVASQALTGCSDKCGNLSIPFPFGMREGCYLNRNFLITCNHSSDYPLPQLIDGNLVVTDITLDGQLDILHFMARDCYDASGRRVRRNIPQLWASMFTISNDKNKFTAIGCDTYATIRAERKDDDGIYYTGCMSYCNKTDTFVHNVSCPGIGCCQVSIPSGLKNINISVTSYNNYSNVWEFNHCGYAFIADQSKFTFTFKSFEELEKIEFLPLVLDWAIGNESCKVAEHKSDYACKQNSTCYDPENRSGYLCKCKHGYYGNPYHPSGCQDIDECKNSTLHDCISERHCVNKLGSYDCYCPNGFHGDGRKNGTRCTAQLSVKGISIAVGISVLVLVGGSWLFFICKKRKLLNMKRKFFQQNGGLMLQQELHKREVSTETTRIFTADELKKATENYDERLIIGKGGSGTVYKGFLKNGVEVAIKKSKFLDQSHIEQFINEVIILSQINHRNVVKLLGCCLETEVPLLVYELVSNGTLSSHIHMSDNKESPVSWEIRLRIATETAQVLSYLHSAASTPIIHRDVKSTNILLDNKYTAKVSDFGASRLVPSDQTRLLTLVQGTLGYLDPEYLHTNQLTEKSDVYSFGVVLVELLTGRKALAFDRPEEERSLTTYFLTSLSDNHWFQILDDQVVKGGAIEQIKEVAELAKRCLRVKGEERPAMKEVATELEGLRMMSEHPWIEVEVNPEETQFLLGGTPIVSA